MSQPQSNASPNDDARDDMHWMRRAISLAKQGQGSVEPNPMVGCVLVRDDQCIGEGYHQDFGGPHAEIVALQRCNDARGATAYVTLEPCCHHGKTPPCSEALIKAGVSRVVTACQDPFPQVDGGGVQQLRQAGITVESGICREESESVLAPYLKRIRTGLPWVIAKWAMSIDGKIATTSGDSKWITGEEARADVHQVRGRVDAILTGMGTVIADDPMLTARPAGPRIAKRVVLCRTRLPDPGCKLITTTDVAPTIVALPNPLRAAAEHLNENPGVTVFPINGLDDVDEERKSIKNLLEELAKQDVTNCVLECGGTLMSRFFEHNFIDEFHVYLGGIAIGGSDAPGPIAGSGIADLSRGKPLFPVEVMQLGRDIRISYR